MVNSLILSMLIIGTASSPVDWSPENMIHQMSGSVSSVSQVASQSTFQEDVTATDTDTWSRTIAGQYQETILGSSDHVASVKQIRSGNLLAFVLNSYNGTSGTKVYKATIQAVTMPTDTWDLFVDEYDISDTNSIQIHKDNGFVVQWSIIVAGPQSGGGGGSG